MPDPFSQAYANLTAFVSEHSEIEIGDSVTSIPENVRADFYLAFNAARNAFVEEKFPSLLNRSKKLQEHYLKAEQELGGLLSWEDVPAVSPVQRFLRNFKDSMARELFDPLFDLLKGRESIESFGQKGSARIAGLWPAVFRGGYEKWAILSLVKLLEPERALRVDVRPLSPGERAKSAAYAPIAETPAPEESTVFLFSQPRNAILAVPDLIVRSAALNRFVGIRSEFREGLYNASNPGDEREWCPIRTDLPALLGCGLTLIYTAENAGQIALVADATRFCRPDMVLWCIDSGSVTRQEALAKMKLADSRLNPIKGIFVVATGPWPECGGADEVEEEPRIRFLNVGFDAFQLRPVTDALVDANVDPQTVNRQS